MQYRRMVPVKRPADIGKGLMGVLSAEVHRDLPRQGQGLLP